MIFVALMALFVVLFLLEGFVYYRRAKARRTWGLGPYRKHRRTGRHRK